MTRDNSVHYLQQYPSIHHLREKARKQIPHVAWTYLEGGTGEEHAISRNTQAFSNITLIPECMTGGLQVSIETSLFGKKYRTPFGVAPVGLAGLIWPGADIVLARTAAKFGFPYCLATVANQTPEVLGPVVGDMGWFQLYPSQDKGLRNDLLIRAKEAGFETLVVTADVPIPSRRESMIRAGLHIPRRLIPRLMVDAVLHPKWLLATLKEGLPRLKTLERYTGGADSAQLSGFVETSVAGSFSLNDLKVIRDRWQGNLVVKGVLNPADVEAVINVGVDGIQVSNHGGRQFDGSPAPIQVLSNLAEQVDGKVVIIFDSGIRSGLDIIRALALGADFVMLGRAFMYSLAALGDEGGDHAARVLVSDLKNNIHQLGLQTVGEIKSLKPFSV